MSFEREGSALSDDINIVFVIQPFTQKSRVKQSTGGLNKLVNGSTGSFQFQILLSITTRRWGVWLFQMLLCSTTACTTKRWSGPIFFFFHFSDIALVNGFILHKQLWERRVETSGSRPITQNKFREKLAAEMLRNSTTTTTPSLSNCPSHTRVLQQWAWFLQQEALQKMHWC